jgi:hypothetical protein
MNPAPTEPGTLAEQLQIVGAFLDLPAHLRRQWPRTSWHTVRQHVLRHARPLRRGDIELLLSQRGGP